MALYKGVYYTDNFQYMNMAAISLAEATSIDENIQAIRNDGLVVPVANAAERDVTFPTPVNGNAVWLEDSAIEQRYITGAGWVAYSDGMMPIPIPSAVPSGTGSSFKILGIGGISFTSCVTLTINNIFTKEFDNYKIIVNIESTSAAIQPQLRYTTNGAANSATNYIRAGIYANSATPTIGANSSAGSVIVLGVSNGTRNITAQIDFMRPAYGYFPLALHTSSASDNSTNVGIHQEATQYNSGTITFDGIQLLNNTGTASMTGNVKVYGYN